MGVDAEMAVALKAGADPDVLNTRFKNTHSQEDTMLGENDVLIRGLADRDLEGIEYVNAYRITTWCRYYGSGYERGPAPEIILTLEWLRAQPEVEAVYYWGDCSDGPSGPWTKEESEALLWHWFKFGHEPYGRGFGCTWALDSWEPKVTT